MKEAVLHLFEQYPETAVAISLFLSILVAVAGVVPSFFITAANILFFGFWPGTVISFLGEALGAVLAFLLYRKGFKKNTNHRLQKFPGVQRLIKAEGRQAFLLILSLRLLPFVPSGLVTFAASIGSVSALHFLAASSIGKIPALFIEAYSVYQVAQFNWQGKVILFLAALFIFYLVAKKLY